MAGTFTFCLDSLVPELIPPEQSGKSMSMNGWYFAAKPNIPYQRSFKVTLHGLYWYLHGNGMFDEVTDPAHNARLLEKFYQQNGTWDSFVFPHPHLGDIVCRFKSPVSVPAAEPNSDGLIKAFEVQLVEHNPGF